MATPAQKDEETAGPVNTWDSNPLVCVSKRTRIFTFPQSILLHEPTKEELARWNSDDEKNRASTREEKTITFYAGVTFLGTWNTAWALRDVENPDRAPTGAPSIDKCVLLKPPTTSTLLSSHHQFKDPATRQILGKEVHKAILRVLKYLQDRDAELVRVGASSGLFSTASGYDSPEILILPLKDILAQKGEAGQVANGYVQEAIPWSKDPYQLGALHDYCVRHPSGMGFVRAARTRGRNWRLSDLSGS